MNVLITIILVAALLLLVVWFFQLFIYLLPAIVIVWAIWALYRAFFPKKTVKQDADSTSSRRTYSSNQRQGTERKDVIDVDFEILDDE